MPAHDREPLALGAVVAGPFGQLKPAFNIDAGARHELVGHLDSLGVERQHGNPLSAVTVTHANGQTQVPLPAGGRLLLSVLAEASEEGSFDCHRSQTSLCSASLFSAIALNCS